MFRLVKETLTLSDGTRVPAGTICAAGATPLHRDEELYANPDDFEPLRFYKPSEDEGIKDAFASPRADYISFGRGRHAWCVLVTLSSLVACSTSSGHLQSWQVLCGS